MKVDLSGQILDMNKEPVFLTNEKGEKTDKPAKFKIICTNALLTSFEDERDLQGDEKYKRFKLADKINTADAEVELSAEEIGLIKKMVGKGYGALFVGQIYDLFESLKGEKQQAASPVVNEG